MLKRLRVQGFKSLVDVEVQFSSLAVLLGLNATGKSNLLDALRLVASIGTSQTVRAAFAPPYRGKPIESFFVGEGGVKELCSKERITFSIEADLRISDRIAAAVGREIRDLGHHGREAVSDGSGDGPAQVRERDLRYRVTIEMLPASGVLRLTDEYLAPLDGGRQPCVRGEPFLERQGGTLLLRPEGHADPIRYDRYLGRSILSMSHQPSRCPHVVAARRELESWRFFDFEPRERMRAPLPIGEVREVGPLGEDLVGYLWTLKAHRPRDFWAIEKALHMMMPEIEGIELDVNDLAEVEMSVMEGGRSMPVRALSDGTLRMIGLLAIAGIEDRPALVCIEEPDKSIHPTRLGLIAELLRTQEWLGLTQWIATSHSPILMDSLPIESLVAVRKSNGQTRIHPVSEWGPLARSEDPRGQCAGQYDRLPVSKRILRGDFSF